MVDDEPGREDFEREMRKRIEAISSGAIGGCGFEPRVSDMMWFGDYGCIK